MKWMRRPFVWVSCCWIAGIGAQDSLWACLFFILVFFLLFFWGEKQVALLSFLFFLFGFSLNFYQQKCYVSSLQIIEQQRKTISVIGRVEEVDQTEKGQFVYLSQNHIFTKKEKCQCLPGKIQIKAYMTEKVRLCIGDMIYVSGSFSLPERARNPGQWDEQQYDRIHWIVCNIFVQSYQIDRSKMTGWKQLLRYKREKWCNYIQQMLPEKEAGILSAMVLGQKNGLETEVKQQYQQNGIAHLLAISGLHVSLIGFFLFDLLQKMGLPNYCSALATGTVLFFYAGLTGASVSTKRAVMMLLFWIAAKLIGRTYDSLSALTWAAWYVLIQNTFLLFDAGFLLSFGSVIGIALVFPIIQQKKQIPIWKELSMNFSVMLVTTPILLASFFEFSPYSMLLNLIVVPLLSVLIFCAIVAFFLKGPFFFGAIHFILLFYEKLCNGCSKLPYPRWIIGKPACWKIVVYYSILAVVLYGIQKKNWRKSLLFLYGCSFLFFRHTVHGLEITFLDVGQGDGIFFETQTGVRYLMDAGSSNNPKLWQYCLEPFLKSKGVRKIDNVFVSHLDTDHVSAILEMLRKMEDQTERLKNNGTFRIGRLILPNTSFKDQAYEAILYLAKRKGVPVSFLERGDSFLDKKQMKDFWITCLHPTVSFIAKDRNAYSMVLDIQYKDFRLLLTGDLEETGEEELLQHCKLPSYTVLKVPHHGSNFSSSAFFLQQVRPLYAIISVAQRNRYGHPGKELLQRLQKVQTKVFMTKERGAIFLQTEGRTIRLQTFLRKESGISKKEIIKLKEENEEK